MLSGADVLAAADQCQDFLATATERSWDVAVPDLDFTVSSVIDHAIQACLWYAMDLSAARHDDQTLQPRVKPGSTPHELLASMATASFQVACVVDACDAGRLGFHPYGWADPSGFAGMSCDELLIHTDDAGRALGLEFRPDDALAGRVLARLFPWVERDPASEAELEAWTLLRWVNGRLELPGRVHQAKWMWHCAPLADWDGTCPNGPQFTTGGADAADG